MDGFVCRKCLVTRLGFETFPQALSTGRVFDVGELRFGVPLIVPLPERLWSALLTKHMNGRAGRVEDPDGKSVVVAYGDPVLGVRHEEASPERQVPYAEKALRSPDDRTKSPDPAMIEVRSNCMSKTMIESRPK